MLAPNFRYLVDGDFNLPHIDWTSHTAPDDGAHDVSLHVFATKKIFIKVFCLPLELTTSWIFSYPIYNL